jgi:abhydrolase domain-containing protein 12
VVAFDYRGFADSSNEIPTEKTLRIDALSVYNWIRAHGIPASRIIVVGHSLGSGVATDLVYTLSLTSQQVCLDS